jgi:hypothetical protein
MVETISGGTMSSSEMLTLTDTVLLSPCCSCAFALSAALSRTMSALRALSLHSNVINSPHRGERG